VFSLICFTEICGVELVCITDTNHCSRVVVDRSNCLKVFNHSLSLKILMQFHNVKLPAEFMT
jgi:hypothetical protein